MVGLDRYLGKDAVMLGLKHNTNVLVDYDPVWEAAFAEERVRLADALGSLAQGIEHYGSTSVPGMTAKPILDILVGVTPLSDWEQCRDPLIGLGYDYAAHAGVPGHYIFGRGRDASERTHLVHVVEFLGESWRSNLAFRDALRSDSALRQAYLAEKQRAVATSPDSRARYNELKQAFIDAAKARLHW
jgi:GrpB-like predicted nucleotidyltransferase (UPF0157 family)